jgi:hypothetical protein
MKKKLKLFSAKIISDYEITRKVLKKELNLCVNAFLFCFLGNVFCNKFRKPNNAFSIVK